MAERERQVLKLPQGMLRNAEVVYLFSPRLKADDTLVDVLKVT